VPGFDYRAAPHHVILGSGLRPALAALLIEQGYQRPLLVSTRGQADRATAYVEGIALADHFDGAAMHTPVEVTDQAMECLTAAAPDCLISFGGGSSTGLGKALAVRTGLPLIAIGTTFSGSEMTAALGETRDGVKRTRRHPKILPRATIYDTDLTIGLPVPIIGASGMNAIAHAVEAVYSPDANPMITPIALDAIRSMSVALRRLVATPEDPDAHEMALRGACQAGLCLNAVGMGLHHKLCHTLGGAFGLPHAETHAVLLPHAMAYNQPAVVDAAQQIAAALDGNDAAAALYALQRDVSPASSLAELGMPEDGIDHAADLATTDPYPNPRPIERGAIRELIARAWEGSPPR
jgi:maleylacetate reductase